MARQIVVIGGGPAGIEAARAAALAGAQVTLVSEGPLGGRAGWDSLLPSKVWIHAVDRLDPHLLPLVPGTPRLDPGPVLAHIQTAAQSWSTTQYTALQALNVTIVDGVAALVSPNEVVVRNEAQGNETRLSADAMIVATGSQPRFPPDLRPDGVRVIAPRFASKLQAIPPSIAVIGGGATGSEFASLFVRLGVEVTWLVSPRGVLPDVHPDAGKLLADTLVRHGLRLHVGPRAHQIEKSDTGIVVHTQDGESFAAAMAFLAVGRRPDLERLNLTALGLQARPDGSIPVDGYGRTALPSLYLVGDATGGEMLANRAMAQAWTAGRSAAGMATSPFRPETIVRVVYSDPQVAEVGMVPRQPHDTVATVRIDARTGLLAHLHETNGGIVELAYTRDQRTLVGGLAVGAHAADVLAPIALAIQLGASIDALKEVFAAHPTASELAFLAARRSDR